ncbi:unnamed protein product [Rhodiola kirilowii]
MAYVYNSDSDEDPMVMSTLATLDNPVVDEYDIDEMEKMKERAAEDPTTEFTQPQITWDHPDFDDISAWETFQQDDENLLEMSVHGEFALRLRIRANIRRDYGYEISYLKAWQAKQLTLVKLFGEWDASFDKLPHLMQALVDHNAETFVKWDGSLYLNRVGRRTGESDRRIAEVRLRGRERGVPVSTTTLNSLFHETRKVIDEAVDFENGRLSHFEVITAMSFYLFAQENVDFAVVEAGLGGARDATNIVTSSELALSVITTIGEEHLAALGGSLESIATAKSGIIKQGRPLVMGGPFLPHIESILRNKASMMSAPVVSASDPGNRSAIKAFIKSADKPYQLCDILMHIKNDIQLSIELLDVNIYMLGSHQLQNAAAATCAALCLREQGWEVTNASVRAGLEQTYMPGRSQILTNKESVALDLAGCTILLDGAHTKESARALVNTIQMTFPDAPLILVVAMASDKDHVAFAREFLYGTQLDAVFLTEVDIAGSKTRTTPSSLLMDYWIQACEGSGINLLVNHDMSLENPKNSCEESIHKTILSIESSLLNAMRSGRDLFRAKGKHGKGIIVVTGSLHIVSSVLSFVRP